MCNDQVDSNSHGKGVILMTGLNIAVQLYTVRGLTAVDFSGTVRRIAEIGYRNVELAGFGNLSSAREVRKVLDDHGVRAISAHYSMDMLEADAARIMDECAVLGNEYVVMPWLGEEQRPRDAAGWRGLADRLSRLGRQLADRGFRLAYHNHDFECEKFEGRPALDLLLERADEMAVFVELADVYWIDRVHRVRSGCVYRCTPLVGADAAAALEGHGCWPREMLCTDWRGCAGFSRNTRRGRAQ